MQIRMLTTVEDSNKFYGEEAKQIGTHQEVEIGQDDGSKEKRLVCTRAPYGVVAENLEHIEETDENGTVGKRLVSVHRVEKLYEGRQYPVPNSQGRNLIRLGYAEEVKA